MWPKFYIFILSNVENNIFAPKNSTTYLRLYISCLSVFMLKNIVNHYNSCEFKITY